MVTKGGESDEGGVDFSDVIDDVVQVGTDETLYVAHHDVSENGITVTVTLALAAVTDVPPTELIPRFAEYVDPDAFDRMFRPLPNGDLRKGGPMHLSIEDIDVAVFNTGRIEIRR